MAANANTKMIIANAPNPTSGSGIYAGRSTALDVFYSSIPTTKILIADVPIDLPSQSTRKDDENNIFVEKAAQMEDLPNGINVDKKYDENISQQVMSSFSIEFLDFSKGLSHNGTVCNGDFCCEFDIDVIDNGSNDKMVNTNIRRKNCIINSMIIFLRFYIARAVAVVLLCSDGIQWLSWIYSDSQTIYS